MTRSDPSARSQLMTVLRGFVAKLGGMCALQLPRIFEYHLGTPNSSVVPGQGPGKGF